MSHGTTALVDLPIDNLVKYNVARFVFCLFERGYTTLNIRTSVREGGPTGDVCIYPKVP